MIVTVSGGWTEGEGKNELDVKVTLVGNDPTDVEHLESIVSDDWTVSGVSFANGALTLDVKASRKTTLEEQAAQQKASDDAAAQDAEAAKAKAIADANAQATKEARIINIA